MFQSLAKSIVNFKHLLVSFLSDAKTCSTFPAGALRNLKLLALTSQLCLESTEQFTNYLLNLAARAAMEMPKLQIMELWNCAALYTAVFRYEATGTPESSACRLTWRRSWVSRASSNPWECDSLITAWQHVASTMHCVSSSS